ncbi:MAG TPA: glycine cleavage system protein GcvH [Candidatus Dormibacteraeota bacterium]
MGDRRYTETHEWVDVADGVATIGITDFAQSQLGDVVFLELPRQGRRLTAGEAFGVIESVKAASDLYAPVAGTVVKVNDRLAANPELVNKDPLGEGWLIKVQADGGVPENLLDEAAYQRLAESGGS